ncbi:response regulator transcription factor [Ramlibacter sp. RBP-2]|uniref:Response regulator transcription factor n=1 Tax=Ramlibacter lithotrophicus TaxID=2606681 RepID=A0A7X6DF53_9BURK|nr:response regulator transcription factor [Ramlibacter lithotrophicus]NKE66032.1 response regulator transcription factor [Ramlibacter lithotrophicus]
MNNAARARPTQVFVIALPLVCWGLERLVQSAHPRFEVIGTATDLDGGLAMLQRVSAHVAVLAIDASRIEVLAEFCAKTQAKLLLVTASSDHAWMDSAVMAGVRGVVRTGEPPEALLKAIEKVDDGELWIDRGATSRIFMEMARQKAADRSDPERSKIATLTLRERQTIAAVASDASAPGKVIADRLCISEHTLRNHLTSIYNKLGVCNRLDLYAFATRHSLHELR